MATVSSHRLCVIDKESDVGYGTFLLMYLSLAVVNLGSMYCQAETALQQISSKSTDSQTEESIARQGLLNNFDYNFYFFTEFPAVPIAVFCG